MNADVAGSGVVGSGVDVVIQVAVPGLDEAVFLPASPSRAEVADLLARGIDVVALRPALDRARDGAENVVLAAPAGDPPVPVLVDAIFRNPAGELAGAPSRPTTSVRRAESAGFVLVSVDLDAIVAPLVSGPAGSDAWRLDDGAVVLRSTAGDLPSAVVTTDIGVVGRRWSVTLAVDEPGMVAPGTVVPLVLGIVAIVLLLLSARLVATALQRRQAATEVARRRASAIVTLSGVAQQSHELGEILPGMAVQLSDTLGLDGLSLSVATATGELPRVLLARRRTRCRRGRAGSSTSTPPTAGETLTIHLHRAERSIAVLRVVAGRDMDNDDLGLLSIAAEMVTSAIVTAQEPRTATGGSQLASRCSTSSRRRSSARPRTSCARR